MIAIIFCTNQGYSERNPNKMSLIDGHIGYITDKYDMKNIYFGIGLFNNKHRIPFGFGYYYDMAVDRDNFEDTESSYNRNPSRDNGSTYDRSLLREINTHHFQIRYPLFFRGKFPFDKFEALYTSGNIVYGTGTAGKGNFMYAYLFGGYVKSTYSQTYEYKLRYDDSKVSKKTKTNENSYRFGIKWDGQYHFMHFWLSPFYDFAKNSSYFGYETGAGLNYGRARLSFVYRSIDKHIWTGGQLGGHWGF